ncbi:MAG: hypothetical protein ABSB35_26755 [Bryobacteraceae bacterium]|jgi:hypothetical protein
MKKQSVTLGSPVEYTEGPEAFRQFDEGVKQILSVPHSTLARRERAYKKKAAANPNRRGPKPKVKPSA